jgi:hypothetical protein
MYWSRNWKTTKDCKKCEYHGIPKNAKTSCVYKYNNYGTCIARKSGRAGQLYTEILPSNQLYENNTSCNSRSKKFIIKSGLLPKKKVGVKESNYSYSYNDLMKRRKNNVADKVPTVKPHFLKYEASDEGKIDFGPNGTIAYPDHENYNNVNRGPKAYYGNQIVIFHKNGDLIAKIKRNRKYQQSTGNEIDQEYWYWYKDETYTHEVIMRHFPGEGLKIQQQTFLDAVQKYTFSKEGYNVDTLQYNDNMNLLPSDWEENGGYKLYTDMTGAETDWFIRVIDNPTVYNYQHKDNRITKTSGYGGQTCGLETRVGLGMKTCENNTTFNPNNKQFHQQGAVDSSTRIDRLRLNAVASNYYCPPNTVSNGKQAWDSCWNGNYLDTIRNTNEYNSGGADWKYNDRLNNFNLDRFPLYKTACHQEKTARRKVAGNVTNSFCLFPK